MSGKYCKLIEQRNDLINFIREKELERIEKDILDFKASICNLSIDELNEKRSELQTKFSQMVLDSDLVMKIAIIESLLNEKLEKEQKNG